MYPRKAAPPLPLWAKLVRASLWALLVPAVLFAGMIFVTGIAYGAALFDVEVAFVTVIWVAVWTLPFVIGYALKYTRKHPRRLVWAASWVWLVVALYVILTLLSSGIIG